MDNLEKNLTNLPKFKLSKKTDFKIKFKIYRFLLFIKLQQLSQSIFHPHSLLAKVSYISLVVVVILGSTAVYAANNDHITPGSTFYPLKKTIENVEQQLSITKKSQVDTLNKLSERRLKEAINLAQDNVDSEKVKDSEVISNNIQVTINEAVDNVGSAIKTSQTISNQGKAKEAKAKIKKQNEEMIKYLEDIENITKNEDKQVVEKVNEAKKKIQKYNEELEKDGLDLKKDIFIKKSEQSKEDNKNEREDKQSGNDGDYKEEERD